ncbi:hypothetical protein HBI56_151160 [Parastagonospora nodorum]|nr:hypothetical protein HBI56_151160 [Parastagonospora nodorum]
MATTIATSIISLAVLLTAFILHRKLRPRTTLPLPPGPKGLPLLGNINDLPPPGTLECHHWLTHKDLYGPLSSLSVLGQPFIIINDASLALELLRDRALIYSGRPEFTFAGSMIGWEHVLGMQQPHARFKQYRKNIAKVASSAATLKVFDGVQEEESVRFLGRVLRGPEALFEHIKMEAGAVILRVTYGYTPWEEKDPLVDMAGTTMVDFADVMIPGKYLVDVLPALRYLPEWFPGSGFKRVARRMARQLDRTVELPYQFVKRQMREKSHKTSYLSEAIKDIGLDPQMEFVHKWSAASMYIAGADTTVASLMTFFLAMMLNPTIQKHAQAELDALTSRTRLPTSADKDSLPYITAILKETHRWHPVAPMSLPHATTQEDVVRGYRIPKGAVVMANTWWFTHDPTVYPEPMEFKPERYMGNDPAPDPRIYTFGFGRRVCPGRYVADNALFITIAQVLSVFNISTVEGEEPAVKFEPGVVSHPVPYKCRITVRDGMAEELVRRSEGVIGVEESDAGVLGEMGAGM